MKTTTKDGRKLSRKDVYYSVEKVNGAYQAICNYIKFLKDVDASNAYYHYTSARDEARRINSINFF